MMVDPSSLDESDSTEPAIFILDCDNTMFDNDSLKSDLDARLESLLGMLLLQQFWSVYEEVRVLTGTVDFPLTCGRFRRFLPDEQSERQLLSTIMQYPFVDRLYPESMATLEYLKTIALP